MISNNKRIAKNTALLYVRMLLIMIVTLFTSRVVLAELGVVDFGIYNVVAGVVAMFAFLKSSMSLSVQRFLSYEMGANNQEQVNKIFNISLYAHIFLAIIVLLIAETFGLWVVKTQLVIPFDRVHAAVIVYQCIVVSSIFSVIEVPFNAFILSSERFNVFAYISVVEVILRLGVAYLLSVCTYDKLESYGFYTMIITLVITVVYVFYSIIKFPEIKFHKVWDNEILKKILSFSFWSLLGELAWVLVLQGINILINIFCGPVVNAARAISYQVNGAISNLTRSFQQAVNPQLIKLYASNDLVQMSSLLYRSTRYSYYLMFLLTVPLLLETPIVLEVWLKEVPEYTTMFCRLVLIGGLFDSLSNLLATIAKAYGRIRNYQLVVSLILALNCPLSYILLKTGYSPEMTMYVYIFISILLLFVRLYFAKKMVRISFYRYFIETIYPILKVTTISILLLLIIYNITIRIYGHFFINSIASILIISTIIYCFGISNDERKGLSKFILKIIKKNPISYEKL